jgi:hypothetical protein
MDTPYGYLVGKDKAKTILNAAGIGANDDIGVNGISFSYNNTLYWILQTDTKFPGETSQSPDGWHIVYSPSQEEKDLGKPEDPIDWEKYLKWIFYVLILFVIAYAIGVIKK